MTKRKGVVVEQAVIGPKEAAVSGPAEIAVVKPEETTKVVTTGAVPGRWRMGYWSGLPQWNCTACPFDTLEGEAEMVAHWQEHHAPRAAAKLVQAYDARGNPIE